MFQVLLVHDVLIGCYYDVESGGFGSFEEFSVADSPPTSIIDGFDLMLAQKIAGAIGHIFIWQDVQARCAFPRSSAIPG